MQEILKKMEKTRTEADMKYFRVRSRLSQEDITTDQ